MSSIYDTKFNRLNSILTTLETGISTYYEQIFRKSELQSLKSISEQLQVERETYYQTIEKNKQECVIPLITKVKQFKETKFTNVKDFKQFEAEMIEIQNKLEMLKNYTIGELSTLELIENDMSLEMDYYNKKIEEWAEPIAVYVNIKANKHKPNNSTHLCKEVRMFQHFVLDSGGFENGWRKDDHQTFLKLRAKHKNVDRLSNAVHELFPDISIEDIKAHEIWYRKYLVLQNKKKEALKQWQSRRSKPSRTRPATVPEFKSKLNQRPQQSRDDIQRALDDWKKYKDTKEKQMKLELEEKKQQQKMMEEIKKKYDEELKAKVAKWKEEEMCLKEKKKFLQKTMEEEDRRKRAIEANKLIKQFQSQDDLLILKIKERKKSKEFIPPKSQTKTIVERDPRRLLKPTKQWIHRVHDDHNYDVAGVQSVYVLPKLGIPEWRKEVK